MYNNNWWSVNYELNNYWEVQYKENCITNATQVSQLCVVKNGLPTSTICILIRVLCW